MAPVTLIKFPTSSPADTTPIQRLKALGHNTEDILAVVGKTEGNGCVNDFSRTLSTHVFEQNLPQSAITIFSGGTEGVLSPHVTFIVSSPQTTGLVAAVGHTRELQPWEIGTEVHVKEVESCVQKLVKDLGLEAREDKVRLVLCKCPLLTSEKIERCEKEPITKDTYESMARSRHAAAMGIATALGEIAAEDVPRVMNGEETLWSNVASCSSGAELEDNHILVLAEAPEQGKLRAVSGYMKDAIDGKTVQRLLGEIDAGKAELVQVFAKAEASPDGRVRGYRHTMNTDSDIHSTRHARAAVGGLVAGLTGDPMVYISGGAEGQGPPGGGSICVVYQLTD